METGKVETHAVAHPDRPHSLGKPIEWKLFIARRFGLSLTVPTRWGNQLNGNLLQLAWKAVHGTLSPLAGETN